MCPWHCKQKRQQRWTKSAGSCNSGVSLIHLQNQALFEPKRRLRRPIPSCGSRAEIPFRQLSKHLRRCGRSHGFFRAPDGDLPAAPKIRSPPLCQRPVSCLRPGTDRIRSPREQTKPPILPSSLRARAAVLCRLPLASEGEWVPALGAAFAVRLLGVSAPARCCRKRHEVQQDDQFRVAGTAASGRTRPY